jgi:hypothetical protein
MTTSDVFTYFKNKINIISKIIKGKIILENSYINIKGLLDERHGECVKM